MNTEYVSDLDILELNHHPKNPWKLFDEQSEESYSSDDSNKNYSWSKIAMERSMRNLNRMKSEDLTNTVSKYSPSTSSVYPNSVNFWGSTSSG